MPRQIWQYGKAVTAGVGGIEHGYEISDTTLELMAEKGVVLVPTDLSIPLFQKMFDIVDFKWNREKELERIKNRHKDRLQRAISAGVTIVTGSDNYLDFEMPQGEAAKNILVAYEEEGMKPLQILSSSTYLSAKFMDKENELGVIKEGAFADIIAVKGDVLNDFSNTMFNVAFVMKDGKVYVDPDGLHTELVIDGSILQTYVGNYQLTPDLVIMVSMDGKQLKAQATGLEAYKFLAKSEKVFVAEDAGLQLTFNLDEDGEVESLTMLRAGQQSIATKIKE